jgi:hypothetical protein
MNSAKFIGTLIGWIIGVLIVAVLYSWYNHVWLQAGVTFWKLVVLAAVVTPILYLCTPKPLDAIVNRLLGAIFLATLVAQVLNWLSLIAFPIFH